mmetsp:Transcript_23000/g.26695  ORF Transcript_23000/g.26695 Transcript_23000/m.26695 type:complete len:560 (-) Transcript_23000:161-1840(-)
MGDEEDFECTYENLKNSTLSACEFVMKYCNDDIEVVDFPEFIFCTANNNIFVVLITIAVASMMIFHFLGSTSENYLAPALSTIADKFKFSETLAGVTLVALANGAPDVISAFSFVSGDAKSFFTSLGSIFGANLFTTTVVLARCIFGANRLKVDAFGPSRDLTFFVITTFYLITLGLTIGIPTGAAVGFLMIYITYFLVVLYGEYQDKKRARQNEIDELAQDGPRAKLESYSVVANFGKLGTLQEHLNEDHYSKDDGDSSFVNSSSVSVDGKRHEAHSFVYRFKWVYQKTKSRLVLQYQTKNWADKSLTEKVLAVYEFPLDIIRDFSIPCTDESRWNRRIAIFTPFFGGVLLLQQLGGIEVVWAWVITAIFGIVMGGLIWKISHRDSIPRKLVIPLCILAIIIAVLWIKLVADVFQDLLTMIKLVSGLPGAFLGLTLVAWGNSTNDFFVDYALAKQGYGKMAVAGVYGGQLFNLLIGFGVSLIKSCAMHGTLPFDLLDGDRVSILNFVILMFVLFNFVLQLAFLCTTRFNISKSFAMFLLVYYLVFFILVTVLSLAKVV